MAAGNGAARARTGQNGVAQGHVTSPYMLKLSKPTVCLSRPLRPPTPVEVNLPSPLACVGTGRCEGRARATGQDDSLLSDRSATLTIAPSIVPTAEPKIATSGVSRRRRVIRRVRAPRDRAGRRT